MAKYRYTMRVKKVVYYDEITVFVDAENETEAKKLAKEKAMYSVYDKAFATTKYDASVVSRVCKPVE